MSKKPPLPPGKHWAVPTKDSNVQHDGEYLHWERCALCVETTRKLILETAPSWSGRQITVGTEVRLSEETRFSTEPEWGMIEEIRFNAYLGETWMFTVEHGRSRVIEAHQVVQARWPD